MQTKDTLNAYFDALQNKGQWSSFLDDDMQFASYTTPIKRATGKANYLEATKRFFGSIQSVEVKEMIVEGEKACVLTRYELQGPAGPPFESHVAEFFVLRDGRISALDIYFDSAPFSK